MKLLVVRDCGGAVLVARDCGGAVLGAFEFVERRMRVSLLMRVATGFIVVLVVASLMYVNSKAREEERALDKDHFTIKYPGIYLVIAFGSLAFFVVAMIVSSFVFKYEQGIEILYGFFALLSLMSLFLACYVLVWRVVVDGDTLKLARTFGKARMTSFSDIAKVRRVGASQKIVAYDKDGKKLFAIESTAIGYMPLSEKLARQGLL
ncbi:MAG: hypothetical protein LBH56_02885 [Coriobacteriales bacterium]|nr:hypothetical protein [Coriobacteriales bacterium]